ncbi:MAG: hypothetical protein SFU85_00725 [Candidatus Methylacidiphilales bacterium]|nr:hypothetical protein [Candidatus Methylacidiphilales bacterium]
MKATTPLTFLTLLLLATSAFSYSFVLPEGMTEVERQRFGRFKSFQIKGVCNEDDLPRLARLGVNTVRGYTIGEPKEMKERLDRAHALGLKVIVSEWMPHHGENKNKEGHKWDFDYTANGDKMVASLMHRIVGFGDHPAILMWGLGNEVHLNEPYLRVANRMSLEIHKRFPNHLTSLTMINAKPEDIEKIKKFAPDIDVLGIQCYSRGAVRGGIKNAETHWGKPFYMSEFNTNGPWNFKNTPWGSPLDEPVSRKVNDLKDCYNAIDESPLCLGSTIFVWGHYAVDDRPTYFSLLLHDNPKGLQDGETFDRLLMTPQADVMTERFTGKAIAGNRAPVITKLEFDGGAGSKVAQPGESMTIRFAAEDSNADTVTFVSWILKAKTKKTTPLAGPLAQASASHAVIQAPTAPGEYLVMVYAMDKKGGTSATVLPFMVPDPAAAASSSANTTATKAATPPPEA